MQRSRQLYSPLPPVSPPASSRSGGLRSALLRPRVLASLLVALLVTATVLCIGLLSVSEEDGGWADSEPLFVGGSGYGKHGGAGANSWRVRPDVRRLTGHYNSSHNESASDGALVPLPDASSDVMGVYARCHNSRQGRKLVTDDAGTICARQNVLSNGCCRSTSALATRSCGMCRTDVQCCRSYEYCVSCCLSHLPADDRADDALPGSAAAQLGAPPRFSFHSFDKCLHLCRTSSRSIKHGNVYKTAVLKHCYTEGEHALPVQFDEQSARVIVAETGHSCTRACNAHREDTANQLASNNAPLPGSTEAAPSVSDDDLDVPPLSLPPPASAALFICHESFLPLINTCDTMRKHFACANDRCDTSAGNDQPALALAAPTTRSGSSDIGGVLLSADGKPMGSCLLNGDAKLFDCEGRHEATRRLCVCIHADKAE